MKQVLLSLTFFTAFTAFCQEESDYSKFAVKLSPTQLLFGEFHLAFEHRIAPHSSFEISAGPTISEIGGTFIITDSDPINNGQYDRQTDFGYFVGLAYRFYPLNYAQAPRGLYVSPELKYRVYNTIFKDVNSFGLSDQKGSTTQTMFRFNIGYQFWPGKKFALDVFTGIGIGTVKQEEYFTNVNYNPDGSYSGTWLKQTSNRASANATFGLKIGIGN